MDFATSLPLAPVGEHAWTGAGDPAFSNGRSMFGGWVCALLLRSVMIEPGTRGDPLSITCLFLDAVTEAPLTVRTSCMRSGGRIEFWRAELHQEGRLRAHAQVVMARRRESKENFQDSQMPDAPPPEELERKESRPMVPFANNLSARWASPSPLVTVEDGRARSLFWTRLASGEPVSHLTLAFLCDFAPPRVIYRRKSMVMASSLSMNVHFHANADDLATVGSDFMLNETLCRRTEGGYYDHELKLWSRSGALLATSEQVALFWE